MLRQYLKIWDWDLIFGRAVKAISTLDVRSLWLNTNATSETLRSHGALRTAGKLQTFHAKLWPGIVLQDHIPNLKIIAQTKEI